MAEIRRARFADALELAPRLRFADAREIAASWGIGVREGLFRCLLGSGRVFALREEGVVVAIWGVVDAAEQGLRIGKPWLLADASLFQGNRAFLRQSRRVVGELLAEYDVLTNLTHAANAAHLRWLAWCGFRELRRHPRYGAAGEAFVEFYQAGSAAGLDEATLRAALERRRPRALPADDALQHFARLGVAALDSARLPPLADLQRLLDAWWQVDGDGAVARLAGIRLLLEVAVRASGRGAVTAAHRGDPAAELFEVLTGLADLAVLHGYGDAGELVIALDLERTSGRWLPADSAADALRALVERTRRLLTVGGQATPLTGSRLWTHALGVKSLGSNGEASASGADHRWAAWSAISPAANADAAGPGPWSLEQRRKLLARPLQEVAPTDWFGCRLGALGALAGEVARVLDDRALGPDQGAAAFGSPLPVGGALTFATAVAEQVSQRVLPVRRVAGAVAGYADRQWLWRLLRVQLLIASDICAPAELARLLLDDVAAQLLASRLETRLARSGDAPTDCLHVLVSEARQWWGADAPMQDLIGWLAEVMRPALIAPGAHRAQLPAAIYVWQQVAAGRLEDLAALLAEATGRGSASFGTAKFRRVFRGALRRTANGWPGGRDVAHPTAKQHAGPLRIVRGS